MSETRSVSIPLVGTAPLLMNNPERSMLAVPESSKASVKRNPSPEEEAASKVYATDKGALYLPTMGFKGALLTAAKGRRIGKEFATTMIRGSVFPATDRTLLFDPKSGKSITDYAIDVRRVVIKGNGIPRARPMIEEWAAEVTFDVGIELAEEVVLNLMERAGAMAGVGDFRPEKSGPFGRFKIKV